MYGEVKQINGKRVATPEYRSWQMMKNRCLNSRAADFKYYGARGITIIKRWLTFDGFIADMGRRPSPLHTLERRKVNKHYCKSNCYWATRQQQARNRNYVKLSIAKAAKIRRLYATGKYRQVDIATFFDVSQVLISKVIRRGVWR